MSGCLLLTSGALLDTLFIDRALNDPVDINAGCVDVVGVKGARLDDVLDLGHRDFARGRHLWIEVARGLAEHEVARWVCSPRFDDGEVGAQPGLAEVLLALELFDGLALGHHGPDAGFGVEGWNTGSAGADAFGKRPLRIELQLKLAGEVETLEQLVLADIGADHLGDLAAVEQDPKAEAVGSGVIRNDGQPLHAGIVYGRDQA